MNNYAFLRFPGFKRKALTLSYDDGVVFDKKLISILDEYGIKATFNINSGLFAKEEGGRRLTEKQAVALYKDSVHEVAVHGVMHLSLADVSSDVGLLDVINDRCNLEKLFDRIIKGMAYANGSYDDKVVEMLKICKINYARTTNSTHNFAIPNDWLRLPATCHHNDPLLMELADKFLEDEYNIRSFWWNRPKLFYLWGHSYEFNDNNNWEIIENFAKKVGNRDDVWYCTNGEVYDYVKAYDNLDFSVDKSIITNNSNIDLYLCYFRENVLVKANSTVKIEKPY